MPIIQVQMLTGRSREQKRTFIEKVAEITIQTLEVPEHAIRIVITEVEPDGRGGLEVKPRWTSSQELRLSPRPIRSDQASVDAARTFV